MAKPQTDDSDDLQALFDSIADSAAKPAPAPAAVAKASKAAIPDSGDSDELEALFDSVVASADAMALDGAAAGHALNSKAAHTAPKSPAVAASPDERQEQVFNKIGQMTRLLHDSLRQLGYDRLLEETAQKLPDARQRLAYISQMTEQAASRVLNATDIAKPIQDRQEKESASLTERWEKLYAKQLTLEEFKLLAGETRNFIAQTTQDSRTVNAQLLEIMMAQDFQDLTGQVIKKIVEMAQTLESGLLSILIEVIPESKRAGVTDDSLLNGPVINASGREDVVANQEQVDDLLESLGF